MDTVYRFCTNCGRLAYLEVLEDEIIIHGKLTKFRYLKCRECGDEVLDTGEDDEQNNSQEAMV